MSETTAVPPAPAISEPTVTTPEPAKVVPLDALLTERKVRQDLEARIAKIEADRKAADEAEAAKRGEFQRLYEEAKAKAEAAEKELTGLRESATKAAERQRERQTARIAALPDSLKALVPDALTGDALDDFLAKLEGMGSATGQPAAPAVTGIPPGRTQGNGDPNALTAEEEAWAQAKGYAGVNPATIKRAFAASSKKAK